MKIDIGISEITLKNCHISLNKDTGKVDYIDIDLNLLAPSGKVVGNYDICKHHDEIESIPEYVKDALILFKEKVESWGREEALTELKLIEAKTESDEQ